MFHFGQLESWIGCYLLPFCPILAWLSEGDLSTKRKRVRELFYTFDQEVLFSLEGARVRVSDGDLIANFGWGY